MASCPGSERTMSENLKQHLDHVWFRSCQKSITLLAAASWLFNPTAGGLLEGQSCSTWGDTEATRGTIWLYEVESNYMPNNQKKKFLIHPSSLKEWGERMESSHLQYCTHGGHALARAFLWVADQLKSVFFQTEEHFRTGTKQLSSCFWSDMKHFTLAFSSLNTKMCVWLLILEFPTAWCSKTGRKRGEGPKQVRLVHSLVFQDEALGISKLSFTWYNLATHGDRLEGFSWWLCRAWTLTLRHYFTASCNGLKSWISMGAKGNFLCG